MSTSHIPVAVIDTSALLALLLPEPSAEAFQAGLSRCGKLLMAEGTLVEVSVVVLRKKGNDALPVLDQLLDDLGIEIVGREEDEKIKAHSEFVRTGHRQYGSGKYGLNFGDMFSYALAKEMGLPLFFQGKDFAMTDLVCAMGELGFQKDHLGVPSIS